MWVAAVRNGAFDTVRDWRTEIHHLVLHIVFDPMALRFRSIEAYHRRVNALQQDGMLYEHMQEAIDSTGNQIVEFFSDNVWT